MYIVHCTGANVDNYVISIMEGLKIYLVSEEQNGGSSTPRKNNYLIVGKTNVYLW